MVLTLTSPESCPGYTWPRGQRVRAGFGTGCVCVNPYSLLPHILFHRRMAQGIGYGSIRIGTRRGAPLRRGKVPSPSPFLTFLYLRTPLE